MICENCSHNCDLSEKKTGICHARSARGGKIVCENYGAVTSLALDPIEKKPLAMFRPGSKILSVGSYGCNMHCMWCQNDSISRGYVRSDHLTPEELADIATDTIKRGNIGIAYTYNEPSVGYEFVMDCASIAKDRGLVNVSVTNGMLARDRFDRLLDRIDAFNIDLKTSDEDRYRYIGGDKELICQNIRSAAEHGVHVELTTLIVPGFNDDAGDIRGIVSFIESIDRKIPLHITRFFPAGLMKDKDPTRLDLLRSFFNIASDRLDNVFLGNV